jgi:phosphate transport system substrate-binding protein
VSDTVVSVAPTDYAPEESLSGPLRVWGDPAFEKLFDGWAEAFVQFHPDVEPSRFLKGTSTAVGALYTDTADIGLFGREIRKLERTSWKRIFDHQPEGFAIATGAYDTFAKTVAIAILVNSANPIERLTLTQLDALYSAARRRGAPAAAYTWGDLGVTEEGWYDRQIVIYGLDPDTGTAQHFRLRVLEDGPWSPAAVLPPGAPDRMYAGSGGHAADALVAALANNEGAIGIAGFRNVDERLKALALSEEGGEYVSGTPETVRNRSYPLSRDVYCFVRDAPHTEWNTVVREFLRFVLSPQGQAVVEQEGDYLPLPDHLLTKEHNRLLELSRGQ